MCGGVQHLLFVFFGRVQHLCGRVQFFLDSPSAGPPSAAPADRPKFRPLPPPCSLFFSLSGGLLVEMWQRFKAEITQSAHLGHKEEALAQGPYANRASRSTSCTVGMSAPTRTARRHGRQNMPAQHSIGECMPLEPCPATRKAFSHGQS